MEEKSISLCLARTRKQTPCKKPPIKGKKRCKMHGGAEGSGAPRGSQNAFKHSLYSYESIQKKREATALIRQWKALMNEIELTDEY